jgi:hypothetical protein
VGPGRKRGEDRNNNNTKDTMLGHIAIDTITGLKGVITAKAELLYSPARWQLTPRYFIKDGKPAEGLWLDEHRLKVGKVHTKFTDPVLTVELGKKAKDTVTGFEGIATARFTYLNGCVRIELQPPVKDGKMVDAAVFDERGLEGTAKAPGGPARSQPTYSTPK